MFAVQAEGSRIVTVEGLGQPGALHPLQRAFIEHHALQCGFCTSGFLMLAAATLQETPDIDEETLRRPWHPTCAAALVTRTSWRQ